MKIVLLLYFLIPIVPLSSYAADEVLVYVNLGPSKEFIESIRAQAKRDAQNDILRNKMGGFYLSQFGEENEEIEISILKKYNIVGKSISCIESPGQKEYSEVYDAIIEAEILRRYGNDFWIKVRNEINIEIERVAKDRKNSDK